MSESVEGSAAKLPPGHAPLLLIQGSFTSFYVACDNTASAAGTTLIEGLDVLFKWLWVFNIKYPVGLQIYYKFLQRLYGVSDGKHGRVPSKVLEMAGLFLV